MASPAGAQMAGPQPQNQQPQAAPVVNNSNVSEDGVSIRPMRLKVLYTFDDECKTNCLARWPHVLQIQTVAMDDTNSIGVIELYTCLQAVIECSPELVPRLGRDFTVYAYDFSEYDNPLVGQGMLSKALTTPPPPPTPNPTNGQPQKLVTGRVCKNILGIFANGVKETLEVKLRFTPVLTTIPNEYANAAGNVSQGISPNFDQNEWNAFMQSNQTAPQMSNRTATPVLAPNNKRDGTSMEVMNQLLSPSLQPVQPAQQAQQAQPAQPVQPIHPAQPSMNSYNQQVFAPSPTIQPSGPTQHAEKEPISRPLSRTIVPKKRRGRPPKKASTAGGHTSGYEDGTDGDDGPMPKKRAKIMQADWNRKSSFGTGSDSLRVTASTAGSIRSFRPLSMNGTQGPGNHLQEVPRAPTPVPILPQLSVQRPQSQSGLRQGSVSQTSPPEDQLSPYPQLEPSLPPEDQLRLSIESANPSPERMMSPAVTPQDIASSPPVLRPATPIGSSPPCPSSPSLPPMPRFDSGFMSGSLDDLFGEEDETLRPIDEEDIEVAKKYTKRRPQRKPQPVVPAPCELQIEEETPGPMELLPTRMPIFEPHKQKILPALLAKSRRGSIISEDGQTLPPLRHDTHASSTRPPPNQSAPMTHPPPSLHLPAPPTSEHPQPHMQQMHVPTVPQPRAASKTMTRTASTGCLPVSDVPASDSILPRTFNRSQTWSAMPNHMSEAPDTTTQLRQADIKKAAIRQKLEAAIANGRMPPYCENCGAIETPTWRKAWSQEHQGAPGYHDYSEEPGRVTSITIQARDAEGKPTSYLLIKKALGPDEDVKQFKEFTLCNPCGIWMSKYKSQRPEERWARGNQDGDSKKKPRSRPSKTKKTAGAPASEANLPQSEGPTGLDRLSPIDLDPVEPVEQAEPKDSTSTEPVENRRSTSVRPAKRLNAMTSGAASAALTRALQSSPARWTKNSSADVAEEPDTTRRVLFPSPRKDGSPKVLGEVTTNAVQVVVDFHSTKDGAVEILDKENTFPNFSAEDDAELMRLFEEELARPTTPDQKTPAANLFKTPTRATPNHRPITRSLSKSTKSVRSPNRHLLPPKTPSRTPGSASRRRSPRGNAVFESPFTAQLNQLMSDAGVRLDSPSRHLDFSNLPDLPNLDNGSYNLQQYDEDFFSTDVPMPSSPPRLFHSLSNPSGGNLDWDNFGLDTNLQQDEKEKSGGVKKEPSDEEGINETA